MKEIQKDIAQTEFPMLPPTPPPNAGTPPARPHPVPPKQKSQKGVSAKAQPAGDPCAALTTAAIQEVINKIEESRKKAASDAAAHGAESGPGYPSSARDNLAYLILARDEMIVLRDWSQTAGVLDPPPFVSNTSGAYNIHGYVRATVIHLHYARHWATISASYHLSKDARDSYELTTRALELIEPLGAQAGRCYMSVFEPFK